MYLAVIDVTNGTNVDVRLGTLEDGGVGAVEVEHGRLHGHEGVGAGTGPGRPHEGGDRPENRHGD